MMLVRTYLSNSPIEGVGIYAAEPIKAGDVIWRLEPKFDVFFTQSDIEELPPHMQDFIARYSYPHMTKPGIWVLEFDNGRFMNHSEAPNTDFTHFAQGFAIRDIAAGEEITCNYHEFDFDLPRMVPVPGEGGERRGARSSLIAASMELTPAPFGYPALLSPRLSTAASSRGKKRDWQGANRSLSYSRVEHKWAWAKPREVMLYFLCPCNAQSEHNKGTKDHMAFLDSGVQPFRGRSAHAVATLDLDVGHETARHDFDAAFVREAIRELKPLYARLERVISPLEWAGYAPYIKAIRELKREAQCRDSGA